MICKGTEQCKFAFIIPFVMIVKGEFDRRSTRCSGGDGFNILVRDSDSIFVPHSCHIDQFKLSPVTPLSQHRDKRGKESVWASLMKIERPQGPKKTPKGGREGKQTTQTNKRAKQNDCVSLKCQSTSWQTRGVLGLIKLFPRNINNY